ncbi:DUF3048 domain-containing protein [Candidatus Roizmanbacteria bacterium]|nr:DUF3048 domain-containing protein [Candidatus Roizmanbacteria bacterium]
MISKKVTIILAVVLFVLSAAGAYWYFSTSTQNKDYLSRIKGKVTEETEEVLDGGSKTEVCPMNGQRYSKAQKKRWDKRRPLGVMIENHLDARPQSGLPSADIIYEAVAEGGITRFLAIYFCEDAKIIGPVRSARIYFVKLLQEYGRNPLHAHVGGANTPGPADALGEIRDLGWDAYNDLNQFAVPFPVYYRDYERLPNRVTEHTMYASTAKLWSYAKKERKLSNVDEKKRSWTGGFTPWKFKDDAKPEGRGTTSKISFSFWEQFAKDYSVVWKYDKQTNSYVRGNGGVSHLDKNTGKALRAKNIVVVSADESPANDGYYGGHLLYDIVGQGEGILFQDGKAIKVSWKKKNEESRMKFFDPSGNEVSLVRGPIFIEIVPTGNKVTY